MSLSGFGLEEEELCCDEIRDRVVDLLAEEDDSSAAPRHSHERVWASAPAHPDHVGSSHVSV